MTDDRKRLQSFGLLVGGILLGWGLLRHFRARPLGLPVASIGATLTFLGLLAPQLLRGPYRAWMALAHVLGAVNTRILLLLTFFFVMVPIGLLRRLIAGSPLVSKPRVDSSGKQTYFSLRKPDARGNKHYENMF